MTFQFPFPTLKNLSMIKIGQAVLQKRTRLKINYFRNMENLNVSDDDCVYKEIHIEDLVPSLVQIRELQHDLSDVIHSMLEETHTICYTFSILRQKGEDVEAKDVALIFDVHGRLDVAAVWRCYFEDQINNAKSVGTVMNLLRFAIPKKIWCEIGTIIAKIMSLVGLNSNLLPKPQLVRNDDGEYVLAYSMGDLLSEPSCASVVSQLRDFLWYIADPHISSNGECFHVPISMLCEGEYVFMREFFVSMEKSEKEFFIQQIIPYLRTRFCDPFAFAAQIVTDLDDTMVSHLMVKVLEQHSFYAAAARTILHNFLRWPSSQFFVPLLELLAPFLNAEDYADFFYEIAEKVLDQRGLGNLYPNILPRFCQAIPLNVKQQLLVGSEWFGKYFTKTCEYLRHDNSDLRDRIITIFSPQVE